MSGDNNIKKFSAADIERYHRGLLSLKERHDLEKAALDDPFLADALEGYAVAGVNITADIADLKQRLAEKTEDRKVVPISGSGKTFSPLLRIAAMIVVLVGAGLLVYQFAFNKKQEPPIAEVKQNPKEEIKAAPVAADTAPGTEGNYKNNQANSTGGSIEEDLKTTSGSTVASTKKGKQSPDKTETARVGETKDYGTQTGTDVILPPDNRVVANAPAKAAEKSEETIRVRGLKTKETAREEAKTTDALAKKQADKDAVTKPELVVVAQGPPQGETKSRQESRSVDFQAKADDKYYLSAQAMNTFRGRVTDNYNTGLPFANVTNTRDNVGTYSDAYGNFTLTSTDSVLNVQVRSLGYNNNNIQLRNNVTSNKVVMQEDRQGLSEVVVSTQKPNSTARGSMDANRKLIEPEPVDGWVKYDSYLANNLNIPEDYHPQPTANTNYVQVSFEVDKNGEPVSIRIEKSLCPSCDEEAKRLVKEGPRFKRNANKKGRTTVTINF